MASEKKKCPACAEAILYDALICKHCRHEFSIEDIQLSVKLSAQARMARKIDKALLEAADVDKIADLEDWSIYKEEAELVARRLEISIEEIYKRAEFRKLEINPNPAPIGRYQWDSNTEKSVRWILSDRAVSKVLSYETIWEISQEQNIFRSDIEEIIREMGLSYYDRAGVRRSAASLRSIESRQKKALPTLKEGIDNLNSMMGCVIAVIIAIFTLATFGIAIQHMFSRH